MKKQNKGTLLVIFLCLLLISCDESTKSNPKDDWERLGSVLDVDVNLHTTNETFQLNSEGNPVVAWVESDKISNSYKLYVKQWDGTTWLQLGNSLNINQFFDISTNVLHLDNEGNPTITWTEKTDGEAYLYVKRWNGASWLQLGEFLNVNPTSSLHHVQSQLDSRGNPIVLWQEGGRSVGSQEDTHVRRWDGDSWVSLFVQNVIIQNADPYERGPYLFGNKTDNPIIVSGVWVRRWNSNEWLPLGEALDENRTYSGIGDSDGFNPSISLDSSSNPVMAWAFSDYKTSYILVHSWNGKVWNQLGSLVNDFDVNEFLQPHLLIDAENSPVVAWTETDVNKASHSGYVRRWNGSSWNELGVFPNVLDFAVILDSKGIPVAVRNSSKGDLYIERWGETDWESVNKLPLQNTRVNDVQFDIKNNVIALSTECANQDNQGNCTNSNIHIQRYVENSIRK